MPGVKFAAWTYNGRIPGPTLRAREGERLRIRFANGSEHPHTIHFHGIHPASMDGVPGLGAGQIEPGGSTVYEFDALPAGLHLYHCHVRPLAEHIAKGLYGAFIIDPAEPREEADELVMVMNGFDTNFDRANEVYAANSIGFAYMDRPIAGEAQRARAGLHRQRARVRPDQLVPPAREPVRLLPDGDVEDPVGADRHGDALPGPARHRSSGASRTPASTCSTRTSPSSPSSAGRASSRSRDGCGTRRPRPGVGARARPAALIVGGIALFAALDAPGLGRAARAARRGAGGRADRALAGRDRADGAQRRAGRRVDRAGRGQRRVRAVQRRRGPDRAARDRDGEGRPAVGRGRGLRGRARDLDAAGRSCTRSRSRSRRRPPTPGSSG